LLNLEKTYFLQFLTKNTNPADLKVSCRNKQIATANTITFLGLTIDKNLSWHAHIEQLIFKLNKVSYMIRFLKRFLSLEILRMVYFLLFYSIILYGIIFWGSSTYSKLYLRSKKG
jgi:hypothetical protein